MQSIIDLCKLSPGPSISPKLVPHAVKYFSVTIGFFQYFFQLDWRDELIPVVSVLWDEIKYVLCHNDSTKPGNLSFVQSRDED